MLSKYALLSGAALCLSNIASAQSSQTCPAGATNCTISVQDAGHNSLTATADNSTTTSSIAGTSSASNQSGNTVAPVFDNSAQTTQNATTTTGSIGSSSTGNMSQNDNASSATNGNQTMGQSNTGTSTNTLGGSSSGGNTLSTGASTSNTGASTSSTGASNAYLGGNNQANGSASTVGATTSSSGGNMLGSDASNSGGNSATNVDASDHSVYRSKAIFIPPVVPGTPPSQLAVGNIIKETSACGPLQRIVRQQVYGTFIGLFGKSSVPQGFSDDIEPYRDDAGNTVDYRMERMADGDIRMFGHQVVMFTTVIGVASNRNIALGGGGGGGSWGQGGMGSSSSNQRLVTNIQLRDCEIGTMRTVLVEVPPKPIRH
ncbi:hypothetical protein ASD39_02015 [Sphingomonas sp. Root50]|nr:hypothetical protein ASD17_00820 [Sphingomonas sp. Root1294]KQY69108.1 hypothetical protein ASD39_02015 [Sphingomonas sp. Root50]